MKPIRVSLHPGMGAQQRGATEKEIIECVSEPNPIPVEMGRLANRKTFHFNSISTINGQYYKYKVVETIYLENPREFVAVTVKVYYSNKERENEN